MNAAIPDLAAHRDALFDQHLDAAGLARWTRELVEAAMLTAGIQAEGSVVTPPVEWPVEVRTAGRSVLLVP